MVHPDAIHDSTVRGGVTSKVVNHHAVHRAQKPIICPWLYLHISFFLSLYFKSLLVFVGEQVILGDSKGECDLIFVISLKSDDISGGTSCRAMCVTKGISNLYFVVRNSDLYESNLLSS